jgi:hypothetical protein
LTSSLNCQNRTRYFFISCRSCLFLFSMLLYLSYSYSYFYCTYYMSFGSELNWYSFLSVFSSVCSVILYWYRGNNWSGVGGRGVANWLALTADCSSIVLTYLLKFSIITSFCLFFSSRLVTLSSNSLVIDLRIWIYSIYLNYCSWYLC